MTDNLTLFKITERSTLFEFFCADIFAEDIDTTDLYIVTANFNGQAFYAENFFAL